MLAVAARLGMAGVPPVCIGSVPLGSFSLTVKPARGGSPLAINAVNQVLPGEKFRYTPERLGPEVSDKARIALVVVPAATESSQVVKVLEARPARKPAEWDVPMRASVVGFVFGPRGLDAKKVSLLVERDPELIPALAEYAEQTATVEALVQTLSSYEESGGTGDLNAALQGFSSQYGVMLPKLDPNAPTDQQAATLLRAILPTLSAYDPLASQRSALVAQSAGLAATVAGLFFGTPVGLAAGGAALVNDMRTMMFPDMDFRSGLVQMEGSSGVQLCAKPQPSRSHARPAYLWMLKIPDVPAPKVSLPGPANVPIGVKSVLKVKSAREADLRYLPRAREWELVSPAHKAAVPVSVEVGSREDAIALDLSGAKVPPGDYRLAAKWDWEPFEVAGTVELHSFSNLSSVQLCAGCGDRLVAGQGLVSVKLTGADFEFVNRLTIRPAGDDSAPPRPISFTLPKGEAGGVQETLEAQLNTSEFAPGRYLLGLTQADGVTQNVPVTIHPPNPTITNLPLRVNVGETEQKIRLQGTGLDRITSLTSQGATWELAAVSAGSHDLSEREATIRLQPGVKVGQELGAVMSVSGLQQPISIPQALRVAPPLPKIVSVKTSLAEEPDVALRSGEIPAGAPMSFALRAENLGTHPVVQLACGDAAETKQELTLHPGDRQGTAQLDFAGENVLFLSLDPGSVGDSGCRLEAVVTTSEAGSSGPYRLGRIVRLPRIFKFILTNERLGGTLYAGTLTGRNLQMIEKTGWNAVRGFPVQGIPTPVPGSDAGEQTLKIALPWPPPSPQAPLYVWLRGENQGRQTRAAY